MWLVAFASKLAVNIWPVQKWVWIWWPTFVKWQTHPPMSAAPACHICNSTISICISTILDFNIFDGKHLLSDRNTTHPFCLTASGLASLAFCFSIELGFKRVLVIRLKYSSRKYSRKCKNTQLDKCSDTDIDRHPDTKSGTTAKLELIGLWIYIPISLKTIWFSPHLSYQLLH